MTVAAEVERRARPGLMVAVLCFAGAVSSYSQSVILLPIVGRLDEYLDTSADNAAWVITATLLVAAVALPTGGRLADLFGKRRVILVALGSLLLGSVIAALSDSLAPLVVGRALQGVTLVVIPVGVSLLRDLLPPQRVPGAIATMGAALGLGGAVGLPPAAWIPQQFDWRMLFWVSSVLAALALLAVLTQIPESPRRSPGTVDVVGIIGLAIGLVCLLLVISKGRVWGWGDPETIVTGVVGAVTLVAWAAYELRRASPLVNLRLAARPTVLVTNLVSALIGFTLLGMLLVSPWLMQVEMDQTVLSSGLWVAPAGFAMLVMSPFSARLVTAFGARSTLRGGTAVMGLGYLFVIVWMDSPWQVMVGVTITFAGLGVAYAAMVGLIMASVPLGETAAANGLNSLMRSIGTSTASAVIIAVLAASTVTLTTDGGMRTVPSRSAFELVYVIGAIAAVVGVALITAIPRVSSASGDPSEESSPTPTSGSRR
ncbi:MFS transporter [Williamsia herbipolensis]|uniref:MFS transporter n=1 Tax=Williamsia herbipolensis TaxID=1603258 RepID=UPI00123775C6|nr:MFS transporter [Williamsia herbipolensis]